MVVEIMAATLTSRDTTGTFAEGPGERELVAERTRAFKKFALPDAADGRKRWRVGGAVGPCHYRLDPFDEKGAWEEIDLTLVPTPGGWADFACVTNGYQVHIWNRVRLTDQGYLYAAEFRRAGSWIRMAPVALLWENATGERQVISKPRPGIEPVIDNETATCTWSDAFGPGLSYRYNLAPDHFFKTVVVERKDALPEPTIDRRGLRLTVVMALAWSRDAGPEAFAAGVECDRFDEKADPDATPDEEVRDPGLYPHRRADGRAAFWVAPPKAWDSWEPGEEDELEEEAAHRWPVSMRLRRRGGQVFAALSLDARALKDATFPVHMDTDIPEEQVAAGMDDGWTYDGSYGADRRTTNYAYGNYTATSVYALMRFQTVPIPQGVTIDTAVVSAYTDAVYDDPRLDQHCEDVDNSVDLDDPNPLIDDRDLTTNYTVWAADDIGTLAWIDAPDISTAVKEVIDRGGWASNNALSVIWKSRLVADKYYSFWTFERLGNGAKFNCSYTEVAPGVAGGSVIGSRIITVM